MALSPVPIAAQLDGLPRDDRGFIVPAEVPWLPSKPMLSKFDPYRTTALSFLFSCNVCGYPLSAAKPLYRIFTQRDAAFSRLDPSTDELGMAGHLSCMLYSAMVCPFWRTPSSRLSKSSTIEPGAKRGSRPAVQGFSSISLLLPAQGNIFGAEGPDISFLYHTLVDDIPFREPTELLPRYLELMVSESADILSGNRRSYWAGSSDERKSLSTYVMGRLRSLTKREPDELVAIRGEHRAVFQLPARV